MHSDHVRQGLSLDLKLTDLPRLVGESCRDVSASAAVESQARAVVCGFYVSTGDQTQVLMVMQQALLLILMALLEILAFQGMCQFHLS